ncbi:MAG: Tol-Pal system beta propeller repeat protein TolB [Desulfobacteraceae bacterium]|nr:Tol-Pal system beta propeller repeat protein TolB [Desulfobacteraceae bacterium]
MSKTFRKFMYGIVLPILFLIIPGNSAGDVKFIDITKPYMRKIPIAVPYFKPVTGETVETETAQAASDLLSDMLTFTGFFKLLDRGAFLIDAENFGIIAPNINFPNWTTVGAELLITGGISIEGELMEIELRLFDTVKQTLLIGKRYKGWVKDQRKVMRKFAGEVIFQLTGSRGIFDSRLAFISTGSGHKEINFCDFDGTGSRQFTSHKSITLFPAWSSDGKWLAYTSYVKGSPDLYIKNISENRGVVFSKKGIQISPAWVPGKFELAAALSFTGDQEIYLLTGEGKIIKRLTKSRGIDVEPTFSPDGTKMAFVSKRSGTPQIYVREMDTGRVERLTFEGRYNTQPDWSPKGDKVAYSGMRDGQINIYVVGLEGDPPMQLTMDQGDNESPSWSPDGSLIAFSSTREGPSRIYICTAFGTDQRRLIKLPGQQSNPRWSPSGVID